MKKLFLLGILPLVAIISVICYYSFFEKIFFFQSIEKNMSSQQKNILLVTPDVTQNGAQLMLLYLAEVLKKNDFNVMVLTLKDGLLKERYERLKIPVFQWRPETTRNIISIYEQMAFLFKRFDLLIVNTFDVTYLSRLCPMCKYIQWTHELILPSDNEYCQNGKVISFPEFKPENHPLIIPSELTLCRLNSFALFQKNPQILYNVIDEAKILSVDDEKVALMKSKYQLDNKMVFTEVASIQKRKGQDIFMRAIELLPPEYLAKSHFIMNGWIPEKDFYNLLKARAEKYDNITFISELPYKEMANVYALTSVLVLPSREDPAPLVVAEAAAHKKPSIISTMVGTTYLTKDSESGFIIPNEDAEALAEKIKYFIDHPDEIEKMGQAANRLYRQIYAPEVFEQNWLKLVKQEMEHQYTIKD